MRVGVPYIRVARPDDAYMAETPGFFAVWPEEGR
jgi:hypothetical protein